jgi:hypothetical protein
MDHLVLVGRHRNPGRQGLSKERSCPINEITNWMGWISKILNLSENLDGGRGAARTVLHALRP